MHLKQIKLKKEIVKKYFGNSTEQGLVFSIIDGIATVTGLPNLKPIFLKRYSSTKTIFTLEEERPRAHIILRRRDEVISPSPVITPIAESTTSIAPRPERLGSAAEITEESSDEASSSIGRSSFTWDWAVLHEALLSGRAEAAARGSISEISEGEETSAATGSETRSPSNAEAFRERLQRSLRTYNAVGLGLREIAEVGEVALPRMTELTGQAVTQQLVASTELQAARTDFSFFGRHLTRNVIIGTASAGALILGIFGIRYCIVNWNSGSSAVPAAPVVPDTEEVASTTWSLTLYGISRITEIIKRARS